MVTNEHTLTELYGLHLNDELGSDDPRWLVIDEKLRKFAESSCRKFAKGLFGYPLETKIDDVHGSLLAKWVGKRFKVDGGNIDPVLVRTAFNDLQSAFRRSRSPTGVSFDGAEETWEAPVPVDPDQPDIFSRVRAALRPFRLPEHSWVREAILAFFLTQQRYPGAPYLHAFGVPFAHREVVYNAAVYDINLAMMAVTDAA